MRIYGLDFTSSPSTTKGLFLAVCKLLGDTLEVEQLVPLNAERNDATFNPFRKWLQGSGEWANPGEWVAGIDFPFGMPVEAIERYGWLANERASQTWTTYIAHIKVEYDKESFRQCIEGWRHPTRTNAKGNPVRVRKHRLTDRLAKSGSPMNYYPPPVCPMFFQGSRLLLDAPPGVSIMPVRPAVTNKVVVEAYPRLVANVFIGPQASYKDKSKKKHKDKEQQKELRRLDEVAKKECREQILSGIMTANPEGRIRGRYGICVQMSDSIRQAAIKDTDGDTLDSILCAVQAAWAFRTEGHGMPRFSVHALTEQILLEGWIADPLVLNRIKNGEG